MSKYNLIKHSLLVMFTVIASMTILSCDDPVEFEPDWADVQVTLAVISDLHYHSPDLGTSGDAFDEYLSSDRKLLAQSQAILTELTDMVIEEDVELVLVAGDMTKDGEKSNHEDVVEFLTAIEASGKIVYVVPGNHDIDNPASVSYPESGDPIAEATITSEEFEELYADFGFLEAIDQDSASLSYIAEPKENLWIMALDACNYEDKFPNQNLIGGAFSEETADWIEDNLTFARQNGIRVMILVHHGIVEHFPGMTLFFEDYLIRDWNDTAKLWAKKSVQLIFSGHHHATDISRKKSKDNYIFDIQTGSAVTWVCPYRTVNVDFTEGVATVNNMQIAEIDYDLGGADFHDFAYDFVAEGLPELVISQLKASGAKPDEAAAIEPLATKSLIAYYRGDEPDYVDQDLMIQIEDMANNGTFLGKQVASLLQGIWTDEVPDNNVIINLNTGDTTKQ